MQAIRAQCCKAVLDAFGNVTSANLYGVDNDLTKQHCLAEKYVRFKTAKQFLGHSKEMHFLEHADTSDFAQDLAWLEAMSV
jgi:hypothetical protein